MASVRQIKKDIDYLVGEVIADCYLTIYFHPEKREAILGLMEQVVELRNQLVASANHPVEKDNSRLVHKHYANLRKELMTGVDDMFVRLSETCKCQGKGAKKAVANS